MNQLFLLQTIIFPQILLHWFSLLRWSQWNLCFSSTVNKQVASNEILHAKFFKSDLTKNLKFFFCTERVLQLWFIGFISEFNIIPYHYNHITCMYSSSERTGFSSKVFIFEHFSGQLLAVFAFQMASRRKKLMTIKATLYEDSE